MNPRVVAVAALFAAASVAQDVRPAGTGERATVESLLRDFDHLEGSADAPTIDQLLGDTLSRLREIDRRSAFALAARLRESERELEAVERRLRDVRGGILVDLPLPPLPRASESDVAAESRALETLRRDLDGARLLKDAKQAPAAKRKGPTSPATASADALLDVPVDVPTPKSGMAGDDIKGALDPEGLSRALFEAGDLEGCVAAIARIPSDRRSTETRYREARALDRLGRWKDAEPVYRAVATADKDGFWGRQAKWMLDFGGKRDATQQRVGVSTGRSEK